MKSQYALARAQGSFGRALRRGVLLAVAASLYAVATAGAITYPVKGGNKFHKDTERWSGTAASCSPGLLCAESNFHSGTEGKPAGSLVSRLDVLVNGGELFEGQATWRSPSFEATTIGGGSLRYDRRMGTTGLLTLGPETGIEPLLVDETSGSFTSLGSETLNSADSVFAARKIVVPKGMLDVGDRYHLELRSAAATTTAQLGLTGSVSVRYDNVALKLKSQGPGGSSGSDGVEFTDPPLTGNEIGEVASQINWPASAGQKPGGSLLSQSKCTIVGTQGADRIIGSTGNDVICGFGGNDRIKGRGGKDIIDGGSGKDRVTGGGKSDVIAALAGKDQIKGGPGGDRLGAGSKGDRVAGNGGRDRLSGGPGRDRISGGPGRDRVLHAGRDRLRGVERH